MMISVLIYILFSSSAEKSEVKNTPSCQVVREEAISFTNSQLKKDKLIVSVSDGSCEQATYKIEIKDPQGKIIYSYKGDLKSHVGASADDPQIVSSAKRLVSLTGKSEKWPNTKSLPKYPKNMDTFEDEHLVRVSVTKKDYERYCQNKQPVFYHLTHYEAWRYLVYDEATQKVVIVLEGGI